MLARTRKLRPSPLLVLALALVGPPPAAEAQDRVVVLDRAEARAVVVDPVTHEALAYIPAGAAPREVVVSPDGRLAYVSNFGRTGVGATRAGSVTVLDLEENQVKKVFRPGSFQQLNGIGLNGSGERLWITAEAEGGVLELDARDGSLLMVWKTGGARSHALALTPDGRKLYVANARSDSLAIIDRMTVAGHRIPTGASPEALDLSPAAGELWVANRLDNSLTVVDTRRERPVATLPSGGMEPVRLRFRPDAREVWVAHHRSRSLVIFDTDRREIDGRVRLPGAPLYIVFSPDGRHALIGLPERNEVAVVDVPARELVGMFPAGSPGGMAWSRLPTPRGATDAGPYSSRLSGRAQGDGEIGGAGARQIQPPRPR